MKKTMLTAIMMLGIIVADILTKRWALDALSHGRSDELAGGLVPLTLAFNKGIAFGIGLPQAGRWIIIGASFFVLFVLAGMLRQTAEGHLGRIVAIALVAAGAIGNLIDRVRWDLGVVDFIGPINLGFMYWPIFNVADMAITVGAISLGVSLWREEAAAGAAAPVQALDSAD